MMLYAFSSRPGHGATLNFDPTQYSHSRTSCFVFFFNEFTRFMKLTAIFLWNKSITSDMKMRSTKNNFLNINLEGQQTERVGAMLSVRSWKIMRVFSPLLRGFSLQFVGQGNNRLLSIWRLFETDVKMEGGVEKCQLKRGKRQSNPPFSCLSLPKGETWGVNKKPNTSK